MTKKEDDQGTQGVTAVEAAENKPEGQLSHVDPADLKQANGDTYRRILGSWQGYDACLRKISAVCWTDNDPLDERDCTANIIRHIRDLQRRATVAESQPAWQDIATAPKDGTPVLAFDIGGCFIAEYRPSIRSWVDGQARCWAPTHWMPLPSPPVGSHGNPASSETSGSAQSAAP